ncbi:MULTISPECIES: hypothetical protein [unclassified Sinorhizobium]|uniref:hypothetical protein n=1 Tax=unclassified Sinorhizobium TaxID=2613772 RepID=UPI0024C46DFC|nr:MULTISPECIES: hypothetical protein [unclassified Sinorhizobium]MDK1479529.1 hypothetical protein [Sinorhizobium sp. 6-117]
MSDQIAMIRELIARLPAPCRLAEMTDAQIVEAGEELSRNADSEWNRLPDETIGPRREGVLGMLLVRKRRQLAYSLKLSNLARDPFQSIPAALLSVAGGSALPGLVTAPPVTFPSFLLAIALSWLRVFAQPIGYGEAALLHYMNQIEAVKGKVMQDDLAEAGRVLIEAYGYVKGQNGNEISHLLASLKAWKAIEEFDGGYRVTETVPFGLGPIEYVS